MNPFYEDLFSWTERGSFWTGKDDGVTIYNLATLIGDVPSEPTPGSAEIRVWSDGGGGLQIGRNCLDSTGCHLLTHDTVQMGVIGRNIGL